MQDHQQSKEKKRKCETTTMDSLVEEIFKAAGVKNEGQNDAMTRLELWLDMEEAAPTTWDPMSSSDDIMLMEDCAPFSSNFYRVVGQVLVEAWNPSVSNRDDDASAFLFAPDVTEDISLFQVPVVRVTRWLRHWMELNVMGASSGAHGSNMTLSQLLLKHCEGNTTMSSTSSGDSTQNENGSDCSVTESGEQRLVPRVHIIKALFHQIAALPQLQHQVHAYTQSLLHNKQEGVSTATRLEQLQASNKISEKLTRELDVHLQHVQDILGDWYTVCNPTLRASFRTQLGRIWQGFVNASSHPPRSVGMGRMENTSACGIASTLAVLNRILMGATCPFHASYQHLLLELLVPLHRPSGMVLWRDQTPLLDLYHVPLVQCFGTLLKQEWRWIPGVVSLLLQPDIWPSSQGAGAASANTPKVVLLLHEIDSYIGLYPKPLTTEMMDSFRDTIGPLTVRLAACISSDNSRMSEQALQFFKNDNFVVIIKSNLQQTLPILLRALCRTSDQMQLPWNPTVRKMTRLVLQELESFDEQAFAQACRSLFETERPVTKQVERLKVSQVKSTSEAPPSQGTAMPKAQEEAPKHDFSLRAGMGSWKPPPSRRGNQSNRMMPPPSRPAAGKGNGKQPPLTITGVAPWAVSSTQSGGASSSSKSSRPIGRGVAPWATARPPTSSSGSFQSPKKGPEVEKGTASQSIPQQPQQQQTISSVKDNGLVPLEEEDSDQHDNNNNSGLAKVRWYMDQLKPPSGDEDEEGTSSWAKAQMAETPTLLPTLKFHDLVFGQELGSGAFGSVRYARQIVKNKTRSHWPEYAVKIVSTQKIEEMGYEQSINREIATLRVLSHPGIARLISSFRFRDGAYLVLEYASGGDLHTLLKNSGSLDLESTKFVVGSVVAALSSIHDLGFVYGDLKPENVLITEMRHIKLTDFGGCRPVTERAKELIRTNGKNVLKELRDGDWQAKKRDHPNEESGDEDGEDAMDVDKEEEREDLRIEGTTAYLPPEVVIGGVPTPAADSWALGCVLYQCIAGRPPLLEDDDAMTRNKIVAFHLSESGQSSRESLFEGNNASLFLPETRELVLRLLGRAPASRPDMLQVAEDRFFSGTNVFELHKNPAHPLDVGSVAPVADAKWSRRQFSSIWAPQPKAYDIGTSSDKGASLWTSKNAPIAEGKEAAAFFSKNHGQASFQSIIPENVPVS